jgi:hypothetical protein
MTRPIIHKRFIDGERTVTAKMSIVDWVMLMTTLNSTIEDFHRARAIRGLSPDAQNLLTLMEAMQNTDRAVPKPRGWEQ